MGNWTRKQIGMFLDKVVERTVGDNRKYNRKMSDETFSYWRKISPQSITKDGLWRPFRATLMSYRSGWRIFKRAKFPEIGDAVNIKGVLYRVIHVYGRDDAGLLEGVVVPNCSSRPDEEDGNFVQYSRNPSDAKAYIGKAYFSGHRLRRSNGECQEWR